MAADVHGGVASDERDVRIIRRALVISPSFFGYEHAIADAIRDAGIETYFLDERPSNSPLARALLRAAPGVTRPWAATYFRQARSRLESLDLDFILVIKGESTPRSFLEDLRRDHPRAVVTYYAYDSLVESAGYANLEGLVDVPLSFDRQDVAQSDSLGYLPLFYTSEFSPQAPEAARSHEVAFIGTVNPERYAVARALSIEFPSSFVHLYAPARWYVPMQKVRSARFRSIDTRHVSTAKLPRSAVAEAFRQSRVVVDQQKAGQGGLTMRTFEAIASGAALVTSNSSILAEQFYDSDRIAVVPHDDPAATTEAVRAMLASGAAATPPASFSAYSIHSWVTDILSLVTASPARTSHTRGPGGRQR
ncbi:glycosyltransferase [Cellulomonas humilata]|uniref:Glycosyltransferase n=1 Tax=Cellulomonas humilata TaxID=144055 RepID=A0A7Y6DVZ2_9CELL|nr:glycosyltransferase [Cellulomonas humilata]NUU16971.1 glycosyltransferase [Cellulomonas humilata]